jgi:hypothetical protein
MQPLKLSPLPCAIPAEENPAVIRGECGFVDEAVVRALMAGPVFTPKLENARVEVAAKGNALDFAGWCLPAPAAAALVPDHTRHPDPPVLGEPGLGEPHRGPHRWWLAGMAGATCSLLFSALLIQLTAHVSRESEQFITIRPRTGAPAGTPQHGTARKTAPQLTRLHESALPPPVTGD